MRKSSSGACAYALTSNACRAPVALRTVIVGHKNPGRSARTSTHLFQLSTKWGAPHLDFEMWDCTNLGSEIAVTHTRRKCNRIRNFRSHFDLIKSHHTRADLAKQTSASKFEEVTYGSCNASFRRDDKSGESCRDPGRRDSPGSCRGSFSSLTRRLTQRVKACASGASKSSHEEVVMDHAMHQSTTRAEKAAGIMIAAILLAMAAFATLR